MIKFDSKAYSSLATKAQQLQDKIASGKKSLSAAEDPVGAAQAILLKEAQSIQESYRANAEVSLSSLALQDSSINTAQDILMQAHTLSFMSQNGSLTTEDLKNIGEQMNALSSQLEAAFNLKTPSGYPFSGFSNTNPFSLGVYQGSSGNPLVSISDNETVNVMLNPQDLPGNPMEASLQAVQSLSATLNAGLTPSNTQVSTLEAAVDALGSFRTVLGSKMGQVENASDKASTKLENYAKLLSNVTDLDYPEAISELQKNTTLMEALGKVFSQTQGLSLVKYI